MGFSLIKYSSITKNIMNEFLSLSFMETIKDELIH